METDMTFGALPALADAAAAEEALPGKVVGYNNNAVFGAVAAPPPPVSTNKKTKSATKKTKSKDSISAPVPKKKATSTKKRNHEEAEVEEDASEEYPQCPVCSKQYNKTSVFVPCNYTIGCNECMRAAFRDHATCPVCHEAVEKLVSMKKGRMPTNWENGGATQAKRVADGLRKYNAIPRSLLSENIRNGSSIVLLSQDCQGRFMINMLGRAAREWGERNTEALADFIHNCAPTPQDLEARRTVPPETRANYNIRLPAGCSKVNLVRIEGRDMPHYADYYVDGFAPRAEEINNTNNDWDGVSFYPEDQRNIAHYPSAIRLPAIGDEPEGTTIRGDEHVRAYFEDNKDSPLINLHESLHRDINKKQIEAAKSANPAYGPAVNTLGRKPKDKAKPKKQIAAALPPPPPTQAIVVSNRSKKLKKSTLQTSIVLTDKQVRVKNITLQWYNAFRKRGIDVVQPLSQKLEMYVYLPVAQE